jgi:hypothetical protein
MIAIACAAGVGLTLVLLVCLLVSNRRKQKVHATDATQLSPPCYLVSHIPSPLQVHDQQMVSQLQKMRTAVLRVEQSQLSQPSDPEQMQAPYGSAPPSGLRCRPPARIPPVLISP